MTDATDPEQIAQAARQRHRAQQRVGEDSPQPHGDLAGHGGAAARRWSGLPLLDRQQRQPGDRETRRVGQDRERRGGPLHQ
ncbi:hypothetical protein ACFVMC_28930 [Nocardia sp. NPDC127579]|uniref:hypothetical protein n=1 Tax=Nocardia sp. NPDC127579 TaxID=3345402 RepID=UPI00363C84BC